MDILLLEDDDKLRNAFHEGLEAFGHTVYSTGSLDDALQKIEQDEPSAVLLDLIIGDDTSADLATLSSILCPNSKILFITGTDEEPVSEVFADETEKVRVLRKPVDLFDLNAAIGS